MSTQYRIDAAHNLVVSTCIGALRFEDMFAHQNRLRADPAFQPSMNQLLDFGAATETNINAEHLRQLAKATLFSATSRRAILAGSDAHFGLGRMYEILRDEGP